MGKGNGSNDYEVSYSRISWLGRKLRLHPNTFNLDRRNDIIFNFERKKQKDSLNIICIDEYTVSLSFVEEILDRFPEINIICLSSVYNDYTAEALNFCHSLDVSLSKSEEIWQFLWEDSYGRVERKINNKADELDSDVA